MGALKLVYCQGMHIIKLVYIPTASESSPKPSNFFDKLVTNFSGSSLPAPLSLTLLLRTLLAETMAA